MCTKLSCDNVTRCYNELVRKSAKREVPISLVSWLKSAFGAEPAQPARLEIVNGGAASFPAWGGTAYDDDTFSGAVDAIARNAAKLKGSHVVNSGGTRRDGDARLNRLLQVRPNAYMNAYDMLYKTVTHAYVSGNGFVLVDKDDRGDARGLYPVDCTTAQFLEDADGELFVRFALQGGDTLTARYSDVVHLRKRFNDSPLFGGDASAIDAAVQASQAQNEGIVSGIRSGASIRGVLKFTSIMAPEKLAEERERFKAEYLAVSNSGGVVTVDQKTDYTPIDSRPASIDAEQMGAVRRKVYSYLGVNESIVSGEYTEAQYSAFYESVLEPIAIQLSAEFTEKVFSRREQAFGNEIVFESNRLQYATFMDKANAIKELVPYGLLTVNQGLEILNLPPMEGGDKRLQTLNVVDADKANDYQLKEVSA